jgi:tRNA dimethylallyltransferase
LGAGALHAELRRRDSKSADAIRPGDPQRILRALEVLDATGSSIAEWQGRQQQPLLSAEETARFVIEPDRSELYRQISARFDRMVERGAVDEVRRLRQRGLDPALPIMKAIGVRELGAYLDGEVDLTAAVEAAKMQTRRYAKRQTTWFRHQMPGWDRVAL